MSEADGAPEVLSAAWWAEHFDHLEPLVGRNLQDTLATLRAGGGLTHSDQHGGFWVATGYEEVLAIAQDWESFSSEHGITVPSGQTSVPAIPEQLDPSRHREFKRLMEGDRVLLSWASANRDEGEFACPFAFDLERESNRHIAFGAGPHRCAGSNLARMNLRIAVREIVERFEDLRLTDDDVRFHSLYSRAPVAVPITYRPGPRLGPAA